jgi:hypothetical protein
MTQPTNPGRGRDNNKRGAPTGNNRGGPPANRGRDSRNTNDDRDRGNRGGTERRPARGPAGLERAQKRSDAPPRTPRTDPATTGEGRMPEPPLAADAPIDVPKKTRKSVEKNASDITHAKRVLQHLTLALSALDERDGRTAIPHLQYIKSQLPRLALIREALGVALYLEEDYKTALSELATYRRLSGGVEHNHLVADALRAIGQGQDKIPGLIRDMENEDATDVTDEARYEGRIVWASWLAETGDIGAARAVLTPTLNETVDQIEEHHLRLWYVAADLATRAGDTDTARSWFARIIESSNSFFDAEQRHANLTNP